MLASAPRPQMPPRAPEPLWRHLIGHRLRLIRRARGETLADVARRAGVSVQYLSEIERGRKEPSSEIVAAVLAALNHSLLEVTSAIADDLRVGPASPTGSRREAGMLALAA